MGIHVQYCCHLDNNSLSDRGSYNCIKLTIYFKTLGSFGYFWKYSHVWSVVTPRKLRIWYSNQSLNQNAECVKKMGRLVPDRYHRAYQQSAEWWCEINLRKRRHGGGWDATQTLTAWVGWSWVSWLRENQMEVSTDIPLVKSGTNVTNSTRNVIDVV